MKIRPDVLTLVQQQVGLEEYSVRVYMDMANWCGFNGFSGAQKFFNERAQEESTHRDKIIDFLLGCNYLPELAPIPSPAYALIALEDCINTGLVHEQKISAAIKKIMEIADSDPEDHVTCAFFQWFINEQVEEESSASLLVTKIKMVKDNPSALYLFDQELAQRFFTPAAEN